MIVNGAGAAETGVGEPTNDDAPAKRTPQTAARSRTVGRIMRSTSAVSGRWQ